MIDRPLVFMCAGGISIPSLVKMIRKNNPNKKIYGIDADKNFTEKNIFDDFYFGYLPNEKKFISRLIEIIDIIGPCTLIPGADNEALELSLYKNILEKRHVLCNVMERKTIEFLIDKYSLNKTIFKLNSEFCVKCIKVKNNIALQEACIKLGYPDKKIILKPIIGRGRRDTFVLCEKTYTNKITDMPPFMTLKEAINKKIINNNMMVMEYIDGDSITIDVLANNGDIVQVIPRIWNEKWRFPFPGQKIISDKNINQLILTINQIKKLHGLFDVDIIRTKEGKIKFLEINPRPSGSIAVSEIAGVPIFSMLENVLKGAQVKNMSLELPKEINNI